MKYDLSDIMKKAHNFYKTGKYTWSESLKKSWKMAKFSVRVKEEIANMVQFEKVMIELEDIKVWDIFIFKIKTISFFIKKFMHYFILFLRHYYLRMLLFPLRCCPKLNHNNILIRVLYKICFITY